MPLKYAHASFTATPAPCNPQQTGLLHKPRQYQLRTLCGTSMPLSGTLYHSTPQDRTLRTKPAWPPSCKQRIRRVLWCALCSTPPIQHHPPSHLLCWNYRQSMHAEMTAMCCCVIIEWNNSKSAADRRACCSLARMLTSSDTDVEKEVHPRNQWAPYTTARISPLSTSTRLPGWSSHPFVFTPFGCRRGLFPFITFHFNGTGRCLQVLRRQKKRK
jgi:hypothetical protein